MDNKLNISQQGTAVAAKANWILGCIHVGITGRDRDVNIPPYSALTPGVLCPVLIPTIQKRFKKTGEGPNKGHNDDQRAENQPYKEILKELKELGCFTQEKSWLGGT